MPSLSLSLSFSLVSYIESRITHVSFPCTAIYILKECALLCSCAFLHNEKSSSIRFLFTDFCFFFSYLLGKETTLPTCTYCTLHVCTGQPRRHILLFLEKSPLRMEITRRPWRYYYTYEVHSNQVKSPGRPTSRNFPFYFCSALKTHIDITIFFLFC